MKKMNRKGQYQTNTMLLFLIAIYFIIVSILYGIVGQGIAKYRPDLVSNFECSTAIGGDCSDIVNQGSYDAGNPRGLTGTTNTINFFSGIVLTFASIPWWANALVFTPLAVLVVWLLVIILLHGG